MKLNRIVHLFFWRLSLLIESDAPLWVIARWLWLNFTHPFTNRFGERGRRFLKRKHEFMKLKNGLELDNDWFTGNVLTWLRVFDDEQIYKKETVRCMEIGSWQGLSAFFTLNELPQASLTCVDTWQGADEHQEMPEQDVLSKIEQTFDSNVSQYANRVIKKKSTSYSYFNDLSKAEKFDMIYVDGSHHSDDVIVDAVKSFEILKKDGILIFDDYFWKYYERTIDNPAGAINAFLRLKKNQLKILAFDYQLVVKKTDNSVR